MMIPVIASPLPLIAPLLLLIRIKEITPSVTPIIPAKQEKSSDKNPKIILNIASTLVWDGSGLLAIAGLTNSDGG